MNNGYWLIVDSRWLSESKQLTTINSKYTSIYKIAYIVIFPHKKSPHEKIIS